MVSLKNFSRGLHLLSAKRFWLSLSLGFIVGWTAVTRAAESPEDQIVLRLKWRHQFQFAGYYAAQAKGYYENEGLDVRIEPGKADESTIAAVLNGKAQFGVSDTDIVFARLKGEPIVACASIFQHSPYIILSLRERNIRKPADLVGSKVMMSDTQGSTQLSAMLMREGINPAGVKLVPHTWQLNDLIEGRVDAISAYANVEPAQLRARGLEPSMLSALDYGVDFYGDTLFTTEAETRRNPQRTEAFIRASLKGWDYALRHQDEIIDLILKMDGVREREVTRETLQAEAAGMMPFILPEIIEIGHMNAGRWQRIAQTFAELNHLPFDDTFDGFMLTPRASHEAARTNRLLQVGAVVILGALLVLLWNLQIRRRVLQRTLELKEEVQLRARAETDLRTSEERFRMMFTRAATGIAVTAPDGRFLQANPAYCKTANYSEAELQTMALIDIIYPEDRPEYRRHLSTLLTGAKDYFVAESRCLKKGGGIAWKRASVSLVRDPEGRPDTIILVAEDITARREAEESSSANAELLRMASHVGGMGAWAIDYPGARVSWSDEIYRIHEVDTSFRPTVAGALDFFPTPSRIPLEAAIRQGEPYDFELELITAKGNRRWVRITSGVDREDGVVKRIYGIFQDITSRRRASEKLMASEAQYRLLFIHNPVPMWVCDTRSLRFLAVNVAAVKRYGYTEPEFREMTIGDIRVGGPLTSVANPTDPRASWSGRHRAKDGTYIEVEATSDDIVFDGSPAILTMCRDVTEFVRVNRAQRMLGACNEALIRAESEADLLENICRIAVDIGGYRMAWVGFAQQDEAKSIRPMAHAGAEDGYLSEIQLTWQDNHPAGRGPAGRAIREGQTTFTEDITLDARFNPWIESALRHGYRGVICLPLRDKERAPGVIGLYSGEVLVVGPDEIQLLQQLVDDLAFGLTAIRSRIERQKTQEAVLAVARGVSAAIDDAFFDQLTQNMVSALGADIGLVARISEDEPGKATTISVVVDGAAGDNFTYSLAGAPCENTANGQPSVILSDVQKRFPDCQLMTDLGVQAYVGYPLGTTGGRTVGVMAVLFRHPVEQTDFIASTLQIFASRAAAELDRQQVNSRVREQAALLDKAQDAILVRDLDDCITYWNKSAERLYGWTAAEAVGRPIAGLLYKEPSSFEEATRQVVSKGEWIGELQQVNKQGVALTVECRWTLVRDEAGTARGVLAINTDITEKKKLELQFLRAQRMESIGTLAGGIAHDLNNVLAPVIMAVDLLKFGEADNHKLSLLGTISTSARRGAEMVSQVLSFARGMEGRRIEVQPRHLINDIEKITQDTFPKNIRIETAVAKNLWPLVGDPTQLHQVLLNLCVNARDAMPDGGNLTITAENMIIDDHYASMNIEAKIGPHVVIEVEDTGTGIPQATIEKIFDPFFTTKEVGKGTGLGLSTTLAIVKSHGGFIRVYSEEKRGSRFRICLPARPSESPSATSSAMTRLPRGKGETILVVDDEAAIRAVTQQTLQAFGYHVVVAGDGAQGVSLYSENRDIIAVVLIDMMMPVMDGPAAIQNLMKINPAIRIIAASGISANGNAAKAAGAGVKHFLPKPFTAETLLTTLRDVIDS